MFPYKNSLHIDRESKEPLFLQLANQFIRLITEGKLATGTKLMSSRNLSELLEVHRKTVVACYEELHIQGWIETIPKRGTFVNNNLPIIEHKKQQAQKIVSQANKTNFKFYSSSILEAKNNVDSKYLYINDGVNDTRLSPINELGKIYRSLTIKKTIYKDLNYGSSYGSAQLISVLTDYLNKTRGLTIGKDQMLITRGSQMGIWLSAKLLLKKKDIILVGETNYSAADLTFLNQNANLHRIQVDEKGIDTDEIAAFCKTNKVKAVYVTPHHHHPTTVTLTAERRLALLNLAQQYNFAIIEDDYDYDFHYNQAPILPLKSYDTHGNVIYIGSVCKTVAPAFRIGYMVAPKNFIDEAAKQRTYIDRQGDSLLALTFAEFIKSGGLDRHIRKVHKLYKVRRNLFCALLTEKLSKYLTFEIPQGGMAVWCILKEPYTWEEVSKIALKNNLKIGNHKRYDLANKGHKGIRIGFASYNTKEVRSLIDKLEVIFKIAEVHIKTRITN